MKFLKELSNALFLFLLSAGIHSHAQTIEKPKIIAINPGHFPTAEMGGTGAPGKDATEYKLNFKIAQYIQEEFTYDPRFDVILTKNENDFNENLSKEILDPFKIKNIRAKMKLKRPSVRGFKPRGNPTATHPSILRYLYSTRLTLEEKAEIELTINIHHDASTKPDSGHSVILSPYNKTYQETKNLALCFLEELNKEQNLSSQENFPNDSIPDFPKNMQEDRMKFRGSGLRFRKLLPEIGNYQIPAKKPTILIEYNFAKKVSIHDDKYFKKMARATYRAILRYYNVDSYESINDKFEIVLRNSKTGYSVKPNKNRISDFVMKDVFGGIKK